MTILSIRQFTGEIPNLPTDRLPDGAAQFAQNCDFTAQELRPLQSLGTHYTTGAGAQPCRAVFTADGSKFFAWDTPTRAFLAPTIDDVHGRVYYNTEGNGLRVSQQSAMYEKTANPRPPAAGTSWSVGVKAPEAVTSTVSVGFSVEFFVQTLRYGVPVKESAVTSSSVVSPGVTYDVTIPADALSATVGVVGKEPEVGVVDVTSTATMTGGSEGVPIGAQVSSKEEFAEFFAGDGALTCTENTLVGSVPTSFPVSAGTKGWLVAKTFAGSFALYIVDSSGSARLNNPTSITYKGASVSSVEALYNAMKTVSVTSADGVSIRFRAKVYDPDTSVVYFDGTCPHVTTAAPLTFTVTIPKFSTLAGTSVGDSQIVTVAYVAVAINIWGEESAPSPPLLVDSRAGLTSVDLSVAHTPDSDEVPLAGMLFYRTYPGLSGDNTSYFLINPTPVVGSGGVYTYTDASVEPQTSTILASNQAEWAQAPDNLKFLTYVGNGSFCGSVGKTLYVSEPYRPHAWAYQLGLPYDIVGIIAVEGGVLATTTLHPYVIYGAHPSQYSQQKLMAEQAGWSNTALAHIEGAAVFASNDGLVRVAGGQASITESQRLFRRKDWRAMYGAVKNNLRLEQHDGRLLGIVDPG